MSAHAEAHAVDHHDDHGHHHKETFITKYIFSQDHKMISKQYLITGLFMGIIGIAMSILFRMQLAWPEKPFTIFEVLLCLSKAAQQDRFRPRGLERTRFRKSEE